MLTNNKYSVSLRPILIPFTQSCCRFSSQNTVAVIAVYQCVVMWGFDYNTSTLRTLQAATAARLTRIARGQRDLNPDAWLSPLDEITALSRVKENHIPHCFSLHQHCKNAAIQSPGGKRNNSNYLIKCIWLLAELCVVFVFLVSISQSWRHNSRGCERLWGESEHFKPEVFSLFLVLWIWCYLISETMW